MTQTTLSIRMDNDIKKRFDAFCAEAGMNASVAVNMFARAVLREQRIPFEITCQSDPFYNKTNQSRLRGTINQLEAGEGLVRKRLDELEALADEI
ncbi:MAG: type II toxin-antitoxin system RelB/DinJ family antitoxin [Candidatus Adiutrix sp.]|jgi:DNA-damage-inducible protein J|nr:type II toxin-antitoxin system RelB/DinJ family antitoxin [Candidatus Adiutrix sp.]